MFSSPLKPFSSPPTLPLPFYRSATIHLPTLLQTDRYLMPNELSLVPYNLFCSLFTWGLFFHKDFFLVSPFRIIFLLLFILCNMLNTCEYQHQLSFPHVTNDYSYMDIMSTISWFVKIKYILNSKPTFPGCSENITNVQCDCTIHYPAIIFVRIETEYFYYYLFVLFILSPQQTTLGISVA